MIVVIEVLEFLEVELGEVEPLEQVGYSFCLAFHLNPIIISTINITSSTSATIAPKCLPLPAAALPFANRYSSSEGGSQNLRS